MSPYLAKGHTSHCVLSLINNHLNQTVTARSCRLLSGIEQARNSECKQPYQLTVSKLYTQPYSSIKDNAC